MVKGEAQEPNWLGPRVGELIRPAFQAPDLLNNTGVSMDTSFVNAWSSDDADISSTGGELVFKGYDLIREHYAGNVRRC